METVHFVLDTRISEFEIIANPIWIEYAYKLKDTVPSVYKSNRGGWHSDNLLDDSSITSMRWAIEDKVRLIRPEVRLTNIWININNNGHSNGRHKHSNSTLSGAYYLRANPKQGDIVFDDAKDWDPSKANKYSIVPKTNMLLVFPSSLNHEVLPNETFQDRISVSFNFI